MHQKIDLYKWIHGWKLTTLSIVTFYAICSNAYTNAASTILEEIVVTAPMHKGEAETAHPVNVLSGEALRRAIAATLGETLKTEVGVSYASFGPGVGQPMVRGQGAPRVLVMQNSLPLADGANGSADHANATEAILAERIEVLRGPATLLYGSGAIGGVINVIDRRVPSHLPPSPEGALEYRHAFNANARVLAGKIDTSVESTAIHLDGFTRDSTDSRAGGGYGRILNSDIESRGASIGLSRVFNRGFIGVAVNRLESDYGIPPGAHVHLHEDHDGDQQEADTSHDGEVVRIDLKQTRYELRSEFTDPLPRVQLLRANFAWSNYAHDEIENGLLGTRFDNRSRDGRIEVVHHLNEHLHGSFGVQFGHRDFKATGEEAFVPNVKSRSWGVFIVEDLHLGEVTWEFGLRLNRDAHAPHTARARSFTTLSASLSALRTVGAHHTLKVGLNSAGRAPTLEELFSNGAHIANASYEIGDSRLGRERSLNLDIGWHFHGDRIDTGIELYSNRYTDFIYQRNTGLMFEAESGLMLETCPAQDIDHCLPVRQWSVADAHFRGIEIELRYRLSDAWRFGITGDHVRGTLRGGVDVPRVPASRIAMSLDWTGVNLNAGLRLEHVFDQPHPGDGEPTVDGHLLLAAHAQYLFVAAKREWTVFLRGENLLDRKIRNAASLLRDIAPEAGRNIEVGIRLLF